MAEKQNTEPTPEEKMDAWTKHMDDMCDRMDAFMAKHSSKKDKRGDGMGAEEGEPAEMASDDDRADEGTDDPSTDIEDRLPPYARRKMADAAHENQLLEAQTKADAVARHWGKRAPMAMMGEPVRVYRRRLASMFKQHSPSFAKADLQLIRDPASWDIAEQQIYADAIKASSDNSAHPPGQLREVTRQDQTGRQISEFYGSVGVTLAPFRSEVFKVRRINRNADNYLGG